MHRHLGWIRQKPDPRDWRFSTPRRILRSLSATSDLTAGMGPQLNQADLGSCGPNTADELIEFDQRAESIPVVGASRLFIYYCTRQLMGTVTQDSGVDNRTMLQALAKYGFCPESMWPYITSQFTVQPPAACYSAALANAISNYSAVTQSLDQMQGCVATGRPFMFGFSVYNQIMSDQAAATGVVSMPSGSSIGGHDVTFCGYTNVQQPGVKPGNVWPAGTFKFRNHWLNSDGTPWGDNGYGYIPYDYTTDSNQAGDFWVVNAVPTVLPNPNPVPVPPVPQPPLPPPPTVPTYSVAQINAAAAGLERSNPWYAREIANVGNAIVATLQKNSMKAVAVPSFEQIEQFAKATGQDVVFVLNWVEANGPAALAIIQKILDLLPKSSAA